MLVRHLAPPEPAAARRLDRRVATATFRRLRRLARDPGALRGPGAPARRRLVALLRAGAGLLAGVPDPLRVAALRGPDLRGFLAEAETWIEVARLAARAADARPGTPGRAAAETALFDRISRTEHLGILVPRGRLDRGFARLSARFAAQRLERLESDLGACLIGLRLAAGPSPRRLQATLRASESAEQGRPATRIDLGTASGPAGALGIEARPGERLRVVLERGLLTVRPTGRPPRFIPWAGTPFAAVVSPLVARRRIPGSPILLAPALRSTPRHLGVGRDIPGLDRRLARALRLLLRAWPEAHRDVVARTAMVVPVREPRLVSYSLADRPGVSFINVHRKTTLVLADDLVHENAHHLLHDLEAVTRLVRRGPEAEEVQAFDSPWRRERRPLRGILHGTFTFLFRAELLLRVAQVDAHAAPFARREFRREMALVGRGLADLRRAGAARLLPRGGRALLAALAAWHGRLRRRAGEVARERRTRYHARVPRSSRRRT